MSIDDLSHLKTLSFNEGMLDFNICKKGGEYRIGDHLLFYPSVDIYKYSVSETKERFLKHILYDLYEFTFMATDKYQHDYEGEDFDQYKDYYHYLIEIIPGFKLFHFNWLKKTDEYLKVGTLYHGFGRLSNCDNPAIENHSIDSRAIELIRRKGILEKLQINRLWRDCHDFIAPIEEDANVDEDGSRVIAYEDILKSIGYPEDMVKFRKITSKYQDDQTSLESTSQNKNSGVLVERVWKNWTGA